MTLEDRIRSSVDAALDDLRTRVEADMRALVDQLIAAAMQEREDAVNSARRQAFDEAWDSARREAAEHGTRAKAVAEQAIAEARAEERTAAGQKIHEAVVATEIRLIQERREADRQALSEREEIQRAAEERLASAAARLSRILDSMRGLDGAVTLTEVLDALGTGIAREASRTAVLVLRSERLIGWKLSGFGPRDLHPKAVDMSVADAGLAGRAVTDGRVIRSDSSATSGLLIDEPAGTDVLALPLLVGGRVVGVVYASREADTDEGARGWQDAVEILTRHAGRGLEALTVQRTTVAAPPRFWVPPPARPDETSADTFTSSTPSSMP